MLNLFIIGPSGCGKSTQAELIAKKYNINHISTGETFRSEMAKGSELGLAAKKYVDQGIWVPSEILIKIVALELSKVDNRNFIVDGTPRIPDQCQLVEDYLAGFGESITALIHLDVTFEEIYKRRQKAGSSFQEKDRSDLSPEAVLQRQQQYLKYNDPIMEYFNKQHKLIRVNGNRPIEPIFEDIVTEIDKLQ